jgi:hypothetical protein
MISPTRPAAGTVETSAASHPSSEHSLGKPAAAVLTALVWIVAALPFVLGVMSCPTARYLHAPCPGCGMTRAMRLLLSGDVAGSLAMHALALPTALSQIALGIATVIAAARFGAPWTLWQKAWGRAAIAFVAIVFVLDLVLWGLRAAGAFGGPVPV